jgi:sortase (surface protein transpeptidase)
MINYRVTELFVVDLDAIHVLEPTESSTLTLITCIHFISSDTHRNGSS